MNIELRHGSGGEETGKLIASLFAKYLTNPILDRMEDGAVLPPLSGVPVMTTDSFVVSPLFFPGGDIGRLSVCGTVNDLASMGARPLYLTAGFILETGLSTDVLEPIVRSMAETAKEAASRSWPVIQRSSKGRAAFTSIPRALAIARRTVRSPREIFTMGMRSSSRGRLVIITPSSSQSACR